MASINDLRNSNPYSNPSYKGSAWQDFVSALGLRNKGDAYKEGMSVQEKEYNAALAQKQYDEEYNLPVNQVERLRAAGINPDLQEGSVDPGSAQPMGEDPSTPPQPTADGEELMPFINGALSAFSTGLGLVSSVQGIQRNHLQNVLQSWTNESAIDQFAKSHALDFLPAAPDAGSSDDGSAFSWQQLALDHAKVFAKKNLPKKMQSRFLDNVQTYWSGAPTTAAAYRTWLDREKNRKDYYSERSSFWSPYDNVLEDLSKPIGEMVEKIFNMRQDADFSDAAADVQENLNRESLNAELDPALAALAQNKTNEATAANAEISSVLRSTMRDILRNLKSTAAKGGIEGTLANIVMLMLSAQSMNMLPNISSISSFLK